MAFNYKKISDFARGNLFGFANLNEIKNNIRYIGEDILGSPAANSDAINFALGDLKLGKEFKGSRATFAFGGAFTLVGTDQYISISDQTANTPGYIMNRPGSIVGGSINLFTSTFTSAVVLTPRIRINGSDVLVLSSLNLNANNTSFKTNTTQARNTDNFVANDILQFFIDITTAGNLVADVFAMVEVVLDT